MATLTTSNGTLSMVTFGFMNPVPFGLAEGAAAIDQPNAKELQTRDFVVSMRLSGGPRRGNL